MHRSWILVVILGVLTLSQVATAAMSSTSYQIRWDTFSTGGSDTASSATYQLRDSVSGSPSGSTAASTSYQLADGYRAGIVDQIISFDLYIQNTTGTTSASQLVNTTVTVASTTAFSVGDWVAVIQDEGPSQVVGIGQLESKTATTLTLDFFGTNGTTPVIDGVNDEVYLLTGSALSLQGIQSDGISTGVVAFDVTVDNESGYVIQLMEDGNLRNGSNEYSDVADGAVTEDEEEFGARSSDTSLLSSAFDTSDAAITSSFQDVVTRSTYVINDRSFVLFKIAASTSTTSATYSNTMTFIASGNF